MFRKHIAIFNHNTNDGGGASGGDAKDTLDKAIDKALEKETGEKDDDASDSGEEKDDKKVKPAPKKDDKADEDADDDTDDDDDMSPEDTVKAKNIFKLLNNPATRKEVIQLLAKEHGVIETPEDKKEVAKSIAQMFEDELGENYKFMAGDLGKAIEKVLKVAVEQQTKDIRESHAAEVAERNKVAASNAVEEIYEKFDIPDDLAKEMNSVLKSIPRPKGQPIDFKFMKTVMFIAASNKDLTVKPKNKTLEDKRAKNRNDLNSRLSSERSGEGKGEEKSKATKKMSLEDSIDAAMETLQQGN